MDAARTIADLADALGKAGVEYFIGGSMASILYGEPRATRDVDVVVTVSPEHQEALIVALSECFYVDAVAVGRAIQTGDSFNAIHQRYIFQVDVFTPLPSLWLEEQFRRRVRRRLPFMSADEEVWLASAEDTLLNKLLWFKSGNEASSVQWRDALGIVKVRRGSLDGDYLDRWSKVLGIDDLLDHVQSEGK